MTSQQFEQEAIKRVKKHEGFRDYLYPDPRNPDIVTGGYGHNFSEPISQVLADKIFEYDWNVAKDELKKVFTWDALNRLPDYKYFVLVEMMFQLGSSTFKEFKKMIEAIQKGDCKEAARQMRDSLWYQQCQQRVDTLAQILESEVR